MGDRVYAAITFGGHIETVAEMEQFVDALVAERLNNPDGTFLPRKDDVGRYIRGCVQAKESPQLHAEEVNYGTFEALEDMVADIHGLGCSTDYQSGGGFDAGIKTIMPDGDEHEVNSHREGGTMIPIEDVIAARNSPTMREAFDKLIADAQLGSGVNLPLFTVSATVESWLKIFMEPS
ncbi:hypothetical protein ABE527_02425 [Brucella sp. TWI432]